MDPDKRSAWLQKLDEECPYQVVLPRRQITEDNEIINFLLLYACKFDMYVEDECAAYVRMPLFFDHASRRKASHLGARVDRIGIHNQRRWPAATVLEAAYY